MGDTKLCDVWNARGCDERMGRQIGETPRDAFNMAVGFRIKTRLHQHIQVPYLLSLASYQTCHSM
eukprot:952777-Rhodomonas_salina.1